ncbi:MAG: hypothetical protein AAFY08_13045 [Planctomycetota bacterium]
MVGNQQQGGASGGRDAFRLVALWRWLDKPYRPQAVGFVSVAVLVLMWLMVVAFSGCTTQQSRTEVLDSAGKVAARHEAGSTTFLQKTESPPSTTVSVDPDGSLTATSTGAFDQPLTETEAAQKTRATMVWLGGGLILLGVVAFVAKTWLPLIPTTAGSYLILAGAGVMALSLIPGWVFTVLLLGGAAAVGISLYANWKTQRAAPAAERSVA